jgi:hypothetical protein
LSGLNFPPRDDFEQHQNQPGGLNLRMLKRDLESAGKLVPKIFVTEYFRSNPCAFQRDQHRDIILISSATVHGEPDI